MMNIMNTDVKERHEPHSQLALPENNAPRPTILNERVTTIPTPSGVFSGWGPKA